GGGVGEISLTALAKELKLDKNSAHHRVRRAIERGYLVNREEKRGMPARIALADPLPDEIEILPDPEVLECWRDDGGVKEGEDTNEVEAKQPFPFIPPDPNSNSPTPPVPSPAPVPSDYDAVLEELAAQGQPTTGFPSQHCDHCGQLGANRASRDGGHDVNDPTRTSGPRQHQQFPGGDGAAGSKDSPRHFAGGCCVTTACCGDRAKSKCPYLGTDVASRLRRPLRCGRRGRAMGSFRQPRVPSNIGAKRREFWLM